MPHQVVVTVSDLHVFGSDIAPLDVETAAASDDLLTLKNQLDEGEVWLPVPGSDGVYEVSSLGRVRRSVGGSNRTYPGRIVKSSDHRSGYKYVRINFGGKKHSCRIHTLVALAFLGPKPEGLQVNHKDGVKSNNSVTNLEYMTCSENIKHSYSIGIRQPHLGYGEKHINAKLTQAQVVEMRRLWSTGEYSKSKIARMFSVHCSTASDAIEGRTWRGAL